jgi:hypothetical protein
MQSAREDETKTVELNLAQSTCTKNAEEHTFKKSSDEIVCFASARVTAGTVGSASKSR